MHIIVVAGPLPAGQAVPGVPRLDRFVRRPRPGEASTEGPCSACDGTGAVARRAGRLRSFSTCGRCRGTGTVEGVQLVRAVGIPGAPNVAALITWAREGRVRTDQKLLLEDQHGADAHGAWTLRWCALDGVRLPTWRSKLCARVALGIAVQADGSEVVGHIAAHAVTDEGHVNIVGLWDLVVDERGEIRRAWSSRRSRWLSRRSDIAFPARMVAEVVREALDLLGTRQTPQPQVAAKALGVAPLPVLRILPAVAATAVLN